MANMLSSGVLELPVQDLLGPLAHGRDTGQKQRSG